MKQRQERSCAQDLEEARRADACVRTLLFEPLGCQGACGSFREVTRRNRPERSSTPHSGDEDIRPDELREYHCCAVREFGIALLAVVSLDHIAMPAFSARLVPVLGSWREVRLSECMRSEASEINTLPRCTTTYNTPRLCRISDCGARPPCKLHGHPIPWTFTRRLKLLISHSSSAQI